MKVIIAGIKISVITNVPGTYSYLGQSIKYLFVIPREGGKISGSASGKCSFLIFNYSGSMNFKGNFYPAGKKIIIEPDTDRIKPVTIFYE